MKGNQIVLPMPSGEVIPFWSSRSRMEKIKRAHEKYRAFSIQETSLDVFLKDLLPRLETDTIRVGANWSGPRLTGFDYSPPEVRRNLEYWIQKLIAPQ